LSSSSEAERTSGRSSPFRSAAKTLSAPLASVVITFWPEKVPLPSFSYHAILSSSAEAERTSGRSSPFKSFAKTLLASSASVVMTFWSEKAPLPSFSYHAILPSYTSDAERTSGRPSSFRSVAKTLSPLSASVVMTFGSEKVPPPSFSYHAIFSLEAERTSGRSFPFRSIAKTLRAEVASSVMTF